MKCRLATLAVFLIATMMCFGQVSLRVPQKTYKPHEKIDFAITNTTDSPVSFCVEFGHWSVSNDEKMESTPTPVFVQKRTTHKWSTLLIGPDVGSSRHSVVIAPGETQHYPIRLSQDGQMRAILYYWLGEIEGTCKNPRGRKTAKSNEFRVE